MLASKHSTTLLTRRRPPPTSTRLAPAKRRNPVAPRAEYRPRGDDGDKGDDKKKDEVKAAAADPRETDRDPAPDDVAPANAASVIISVSTGLMINSAGFAACYRLFPSLQILASVVEERQDPALFAFFQKVGVILASPVDIFLLTVCLLLIEFMKWLNDE